ncbi:unnamed protein product [Calypogeia fissa]
MICLSTMAELVLPGSTSGKKDWGKLNAVPSEFQTLWLRSLPKLLWELKHLHSNVSQAVLEMLLYIGRSSAEGSALAESYTGLQQAMVPFFCTFLPSKQKDETRCSYGPFIKLPQSRQELAADLLYFYTKFSPLFLKVLAQCSLCPDLDVAISIRIVELLQRAFCRGDIGLGEHLSFLFTLLVGHVHSQGDSSFRKPPPETDAASASAYDEDLELKIRQRHSAITGVVCACLAQFGDGNIVLSLLGPSIKAELAMMKPLVPVIMAHVCSAMTHLVLDIRIAACTFLDLLVHHCSTLVVPFFSDQIVQHYISLLGKGGISGQPGNRLSSVLSSLEHFLLALKQNSVTTRRPFTSSMTHRWGVTVCSCNLGTVEGLQALHAYKSALPEGNPVERLSFQQGGQSATELANQNTGRLGHISLTSSQLVPVLLECWAEYAPMVCNAPNPDASSQQP